MNRNIRKLTALAGKDERRILGLMSGTSLDGLDIASCLVTASGFQTKVIVEHFETVAYDADFQRELRAVCFQETVSLQRLTLLNALIASRHAEMVNTFTERHGIIKEDIDLIASHGQTIYHAPKHFHNDSRIGHATLQLGDGDLLSVKTGIITVSDFRQKNIAKGGEGAPLAVYGDILLFAQKQTNVLLLNIGGIANFTYLPDGGSILFSDIGPGNTLMDLWMRLHFEGKQFDKNADVAKRGIVDEVLLEALKAHPFFKATFPKTTGQELFNETFIQAALQATNPATPSKEDVMATLNKFTADVICNALNKVTGNSSYKMYVSGGGVHNPLLMRHFKEKLGNASIHSTSEKKIPPDAKEAVLFALLANECVAGDPQTFTGISNGLPAVSMGKISFPC